MLTLISNSEAYDCTTVPVSKFAECCIFPVITNENVLLKEIIISNFKENKSEALKQCVRKVALRN